MKGIAALIFQIYNQSQSKYNLLFREKVMGQ